MDTPQNKNEENTPKLYTIKLKADGLSALNGFLSRAQCNGLQEANALLVLVNTIKEQIKE